MSDVEQKLLTRARDAQGSREACSRGEAEGRARMREPGAARSTRSVEAPTESQTQRTVEPEDPEGKINKKPIEISRMPGAKGDEDTDAMKMHDDSGYRAGEPSASEMGQRMPEEEGAMDETMEGQPSRIQRMGEDDLQEKPMAQRDAMKGYDDEAKMKPLAQRECATCGQEAKRMVQRRGKERDGAFKASKDVSRNVGEMTRSGGKPLPESERAYLEPRFGRDLSHVRIHNDDRAAKTSQAIQAKAFTVGNDIAFNKGYYQPGTHEGRKLLAHEITHTIQQTGGRTNGAGGKARGVNREVVQRKMNWAGEWNWPYKSKGKYIPWMGWNTGWERIASAKGGLGARYFDTAAEWKSVLTSPNTGYDLGPLDRYGGAELSEFNAWSFLYGFLGAATHPGEARKEPSRGERWGPVYDVSRPPNGKEISAFIQALYGIGDKLDLPNVIAPFDAEIPPLFGPSWMTQTLRRLFARFIQMYHKEIISEFNSGSITKKGKDGRQVPIRIEDFATATAELGTQGGNVVGEQLVKTGLSGAYTRVGEYVRLLKRNKIKSDTKAFAQTKLDVQMYGVLLGSAIKSAKARNKTPQDFTGLIFNIVTSFVDIKNPAGKIAFETFKAVVPELIKQLFVEKDVKAAAISFERTLVALEGTVLEKNDGTNLGQSFYSGITLAR